MNPLIRNKLRLSGIKANLAFGSKDYQKKFQPCGYYLEEIIKTGRKTEKEKIYELRAKPSDRILELYPVYFARQTHSRYIYISQLASIEKLFKSIRFVFTLENQ